MLRPYARSRFRPFFLLLFSGLFLAPGLSACAAKEAPMHTEHTGALPTTGRVVVRSGLAWMNEEAPLFRALAASLAPMLQQRGLSVTRAPASTLSPMPGMRDPGPAAEAPLGAPPRPHAAAGDQGAADAAARNASMKPLRLQPYTVPGSDAKLPPSVLAIAPVDPMEILFARSQADGMPLLRRGGRIPGRVPPEMTAVDPSLADYTLVVRVTLVRPQSMHAGGGLGGMGSLSAGATGVGGVSTMGYGRSAPSAPPAPVYGGSPYDYARGYAGSAPGQDPWHRDSDYLARDYMTRYGPQPQYATPPAVPGREGGAATTPGAPGAFGPAGAGGGPGLPPDADPVFLSAVPGGVTGFALEMECYDLRALPADGSRPKPIWISVVQRRADVDGLPAALPGMLREALRQK